MTNKNYKTSSEIAEAVGLTRQAIYQYEKLGLIEPAIKTENLRLYASNIIERIKRIQELKNKYHLKAIKEVLERES